MAFGLIKSYYYVLTATDNIGNENTIANYPSENVVRAEIDDVHWEHNEWRIPRASTT